MARFRRSFIFIVVAVGLTPVFAPAQNTASADAGHSDWRARLNQELQLMGHRNWIAVVDSAYPLQTSAGIETVETNDDQLEVVKTVLGQIAKSEHVRPVIFTDAELKVVPESDAKGVTTYRDALATVLGKAEAQSLPHEEIISKLDEAG